MIATYAALDGIRGVYVKFGLEVPADLANDLGTLEREIRRCVEDDIRAKLKEAEARLESIKTAEEKRAGLREEIARLRGKLEG